MSDKTGTSNQSVAPAGQDPASPAATTTPPVAVVEPQSSGSQQPGAGTSTSTTSPQGLPDTFPAENDEAAWNALPKWVRDLRKENAERRVKLNEKDTALNETANKLKEYTDREKTDAERLNDTVTDLNTKLSESDKTIRNLRSQIVAQKLGVIDPEVAASLINWDSVGNSEQDLEDAFKTLLENKPYLKAADTTPPTQQATPPNGTPPANSSSPANMSGPRGEATSVKSFSRAELAAMTPEQYEANQKDIDAALAAGRISN